MKDNSYYLNVLPIETFTVNDVLDCSFECLSHSLCYSVNMAASKEANGKLWCELLSSDKYRASSEYKVNQTSHHYFIKVGGVVFKVRTWYQNGFS